MIGALLLVFSVSLNVLLARRVQSLRVQSENRLAPLLTVGTLVPPITAERIDGKNETLTYSSSPAPTVLYIFTPPCTWCARNMDNFKTLVEKGSGRYRFIGLSLEDQGLAGYVKKYDLTLPVYARLSPQTKETYKLSGTPQTIVISSDGRVLQNWMGAYIGDRKSQIEAFFHVALPGIREPQKYP